MTGVDIFEVARITPAGADAVFGLVAMAHPDVTPEGWATFLHENSQDGARPRGIFALRDARGMPHALFTFRVTQSIAGTAALEIAELAMLRLPGTHLVDALLAEGASAVSKDVATKAYAEAQKILVDDVALNWLYEMQNVTINRKKVKNLVNTGIGLNQYMDEVWISK